MRNRMLALGVIALLAVSVALLGGEKGKEDVASHVAELQSKLGLTDTQTAEVRALMEETHQRWGELKASGKDEAALAEAKKQLKADYKTRIKSILTADQFARYEQMRAEYERQKQAKKGH